MNKNSIIVLLGVTVGLMVVTFIVVDVVKERPIVVSVNDYNDYIENLEKGRREADNARKEWKSHSEERQNAELKGLEAMNIPDLSKKAVSILARSEDSQYIVNKTIHVCRQKGFTIITPPWVKGTKPDDNKFWSIVYRAEFDTNHDWWLEQNNVFGQYRLVGNPKMHIYFSINDEDKLKVLLSHIVIIGEVKPFYWIEDDKSSIREDYCEALSLSEAETFFPETSVKMAEGGVYARHPCNPYALVPIENFHASLAMDKAVECVVLLGRMGAKSVRVSHMNGKKLDAGGGAGFSACGYNAKVNGELVSGMQSKMNMEVVFSGASMDDVTPALLQNSIWHKSGKTLGAILEARVSGNSLKEWNIAEEEQSDYSFDFKAAASVLRIAEAELRAKFANVQQSQRTFHVIF